jgi:hypothetical protein
MVRVINAPIGSVFKSVRAGADPTPVADAPVADAPVADADAGAQSGTPSGAGDAADDAGDDVTRPVRSRSAMAVNDDDDDTAQDSVTTPLVDAPQADVVPTAGTPLSAPPPAPLGTLMGLPPPLSADDGKKLPLETLSLSLERLNRGLFQMPTGQPVPTYLDIGRLTDLKDRPCGACLRLNGPEVTTKCPVCTAAGNSSGAQYRMLQDVCASTYRIDSKNQAVPFIKAFCPHCALQGKKQIADKKGNCAKCNAAFANGICGECKLCGGCAMVKSGLRRAPEDLKVPMDEKVKFLVTNDLAIYEGTPANSLHLMKTLVKDLGSVKDPEAVAITPRHIQALLAHALLGSVTILKDTFPPK